MALQVFPVLYTHQKTKKSKTWHDGIVKISQEGKIATLYNDKGQRMESVFLKINKLNPGDELESDHYLITVEGEDINGGVIHSSTEEAPKFTDVTLKPVRPLPRIGLKRKISGFQCPREIAKKTCVETEDTRSTSSHGLTSQMCAASPLFETPYLRNEVMIPAQCPSNASWNHSPRHRNTQDRNLPSPFFCSNTSPNKTVKCEIDSGSNFAATSTDSIHKHNNRSRAQILSLLDSRCNKHTSSSKPKEDNKDISALSKIKMINTMLTGVSEAENVSGIGQNYPHAQHPISVEPSLSRSRWNVYLKDSSASDSKKDTSDKSEMSNRKQCISNSVVSDSSQGEISHEDNISVSEKFQLPVKKQILEFSNNLHLSLQPSVRLATLELKSPICINKPVNSSLTFTKNTLEKNSKLEDCKSYVQNVKEQKTNLKNVSHAAKFSHQKCLDGEVTIPEKNADNCTDEDEIGDEQISEVSFNLLDNFDFADSDSEDSPVVSNGCLKIQNGKREGSPLGKHTNESAVENNFSVSDQLSLICQNEEHSLNKLKNEENIITTDSQKREMLPSCTPENDFPISDNVVCTNDICIVEEECKIQFGQNTEDCTETPSTWTERTLKNSVSNVNTELPCDDEHTIENCILEINKSPGNSSKTEGPVQNGKIFHQCYKHAQVLQQNIKEDIYKCVKKSLPNLQAFKNNMHNLHESVMFGGKQLMSFKNIDSENSISVLKELTKHNNALESLDILKDDFVSAEEDYSGQAEDVPTKEFSFPQRNRNTQDLDFLWDLSQWPSKQLNIPILQEKPKTDRPLLLRPRPENTAVPNEDKKETQNIHTMNAATSLNQSKLLKQEAILTTPESTDLPKLAPSGNEFSANLLARNSTLFPSICPEKNHFISVVKFNGREDSGLQEQTEDCSQNSLKSQSKWAKYDTSHCKNQNYKDMKQIEDFCALSVFEKDPHVVESGDGDKVSGESAHLSLLKGTLSNMNTIQQQHQFLTAARNRQNNVLEKPLLCQAVGNKTSCELNFPSRDAVKLVVGFPKRETYIPVLYQSATQYKHVFTAALTEHLNIMMFELSQQFHKALSKIDMSFYTSSSAANEASKQNAAPLCQHFQPAKLVMVKKEGPNKGRLFYTCDAAKPDQCKYFKWLDDVKCTDPGQRKEESKVIMSDMKSLANYVRCQKIGLYEESQLIIRKTFRFQNKRFAKFKKIMKGESEFVDESKNKLFLKLSRKEASSTYNKDDLWVVSKTLEFDPMDTFIACSVFFGPSANNEIEILPLKGYSPSNWPLNLVVHALLVCNASAELASLRNLQEHFNPSTLPILPHLLNMQSGAKKSHKVFSGRFNPPSLIANVSKTRALPSCSFIFGKAQLMIQQFNLNEDQTAALMQVAHMMTAAEGSPPITVIHGVFGAGKSYLLAVVILFLVQLFECKDIKENSSPWKLLISSSTNVAVDRVLLGLLDFGFNQFIRVGSIRKIAKPVLPYSLHAGSENESEQMKELLTLLKEDLTPLEKAYVKKSIEQHKLGTNKMLLGQVHVVGATCAACPFACLSNLNFPVVVLDECSQMTEPASVLPIARFQCEKLILVGDPKQLSPTIQGSESAHENGLEQTLFNRLCMMGYNATMLRTQYRCHPTICAISNELFYNNLLMNGVSENDRSPLLDWLPTLCFYSVNGTEQVEGNNSFNNMEEAKFTVKLIQSLITSGIEGSMIGVITLYKSQMFKICSLLHNATYCSPMEIKAVQVSTVDAFQGAEKEIIILSCVRTKQVGFIDSEKRMNVALTRGKKHLLITGNLACLTKNKLWEHVIHHCERQKDGLKHVNQWEEKLNTILQNYQEKKLEEEVNTKRNSKAE
ncbi:hypothetical protein GDO86_000620 [Hymenochirus boettgeri]|uniref:5'-3' DNA helicase ZGRF1 n=1 Tax=Hymenochirus boettgeri TaxID=247094 RepID=A0A8T2KCF1_9PIPI|nr:hypothetical protein GDO86_000620 [Hymenochirus boettgeri]KAG8454052.1 hypothetical protein GDO86_000620 [Hymenochirus boettgeri]